MYNQLVVERLEYEGDEGVDDEIEEEGASWALYIQASESLCPRNETWIKNQPVLMTSIDSVFLYSISPKCDFLRIIVSYTSKGTR